MADPVTMPDSNFKQLLEILSVVVVSAFAGLGFVRAKKNKHEEPEEPHYPTHQITLQLEAMLNDRFTQFERRFWFEQEERERVRSLRLTQLENSVEDLKRRVRGGR